MQGSRLVLEFTPLRINRLSVVSRTPHLAEICGAAAQLVSNPGTISITICPAPLTSSNIKRPSVPFWGSSSTIGNTVEGDDGSPRLDSEGMSGCSHCFSNPACTTTTPGANHAWMFASSSTSRIERTLMQFLTFRLQFRSDCHEDSGPLPKVVWPETALES